jgi:hypothetical protein
MLALNQCKTSTFIIAIMIFIMVKFSNSNAGHTGTAVPNILCTINIRT